MRQDISEKLADILEYGAPLLDGVHDAGEVVVQQHHIGRLFCYVRADRAHGDTDMRAF